MPSCCEFGLLHIKRVGFGGEVRVMPSFCDFGLLHSKRLGFGVGGGGG